MIYDISPLISPRLAVWPGDTPFSRQILRDLSAGDNITLSTMRATLHLGAHADAPSHYGKDAASIDRRSLDYYLGPCQVINVKSKGIIRPTDVTSPILAPRVLIHTGTFPSAEEFRTDFAALSPAFVAWLHEQGTVLVGVDAPSVDPYESTDLPAHKRCLANNMAILEMLVLDGVPEGLYELIALPLKLEDGDASPVRAILRTLTP